MKRKSALDIHPEGSIQIIFFFLFNRLRD